VNEEILAHWGAVAPKTNKQVGRAGITSDSCKIKCLYTCDIWDSHSSVGENVVVYYIAFSGK